MEPNDQCRTIAYRDESDVDTSIVQKFVIEGEIPGQKEEDGEAPESSKFEAGLRKPSD